MLTEDLQTYYLICKVVAPVSYTHLDVYKRQVKLVRPFQTTGSDDVGIIEVDETGMKDASGSLTAAKYCARFADVYKRQDQE